LEGASTLLDAFDGGVTGKRRFFGDADGGIEGFGVVGPDCGGGEVREAGEVLARLGVW